MSRRFLLVLVVVLGVMLVLAPTAAAAISLTSIAPTEGRAASTVTCTVHGSFHAWGTGIFDWGKPVFQLKLGPAVIGGTTVSATTTSASVKFSFAGDASLGKYSLGASQSNLFVTETASLSDAFTLLPPLPVISAIAPSTAVALSGDTALTVNGKYFQMDFLFFQGSRVYWNGSPLTTQFVSDTQLKATIPAAKLVAPGTALVTVHNVTNNTYSNAKMFTITAPTPAITVLDPSSAVAGGPALSLGVTGSKFVTGAVVLWNTTALTTIVDSATHLTASLPAPLIATAGNATVTVRNGGPGAPVSNALTFSIGNLAPTLASIVPTSVWAGYVGPVTLAANGLNFVSGAHIWLGAVEKTDTAFVNSTQLTVALTPADMAPAGTIMVSVKNPPAPGASSGSLPLAVNAETTDPVVTISGADALWHSAAVALTFSASDAQSGVQLLQYRSSPAVPSWTTGTAYTVPVTEQGKITVEAQALDWCNRVGTATATVKIDTTKPTTGAVNAVTVKRYATAKLKFRIGEPAALSPTAKVVLKVKRTSDGGTVMTKTLKTVPVNAQRSYSFTVKFKAGAYRWYVYATDLAGNTQANIASKRFTVW